MPEERIIFVNLVRVHIQSTCRRRAGEGELDCLFLPARPVEVSGMCGRPLTWARLSRVGLADRVAGRAGELLLKVPNYESGEYTTRLVCPSSVA